jgi:hypothetical protein
LVESIVRMNELLRSSERTRERPSTVSGSRIEVEHGR